MIFSPVTVRVMSSMDPVVNSHHITLQEYYVMLGSSDDAQFLEIDLSTLRS